MQNDNVFMSEDLKDAVYEDTAPEKYFTEPQTYLNIGDSHFKCSFHSFGKVNDDNILSFITNSNVFYYLLLGENIEFVFDLITKKSIIFNVDKNIHKIEKYDDIYLVSINVGDFNHGI